MPRTIRRHSRAKSARLREGIAGEARERAPEAAIGIEVTNAYPGLDTPADAAVVAFVRSLTGANRTIKVAFGTEGGLFAGRARDADRGLRTGLDGAGPQA